MGLLPFVGVVKNLKYSDEVADIAKNAESIDDLIKGINKIGGFKDVAGNPLVIKKLADGSYEMLDASGNLINKIDDMPGLLEQMGVKIGKGPEVPKGMPKAPDVTVNFKSGYDKHLIEVEGFKAKPTIGIKGGHNLENLEKYILDNFGDQVKNINQAVTKTPHPDIPGIYEVKYKLPVYDGLSIANGGKGNFTGQWKEYKNPKTVYDPKVFSDEQILKLGREAMEEGIRSNRIRIDTRPNAVSDELLGYVEVDGKKLQFIGYRDKVTGEITNFFPVIPKN